MLLSCSLAFNLSSVHRQRTARSPLGLQLLLDASSTVLKEADSPSQRSLAGQFNPEKLRAGAIGDTGPFDKDASGQANVVNPGLAVDDHAQLAGLRRLKPGSTFKQAARQAHVEQTHRDVADEHRAGCRV